MGLSTKKTTQTVDQTTTPQVPAWGTSSLQDLNSQIESLAHTNPQSYVPPASQLQQQAFNAAGHLGGGGQAGGWQGDLNSAGGLIGQGTSDSTFLGDVSKFLNPELQSVVDTSLADFDHNAGQVRARQEAMGAANDAFGGSRWGLQEGATEGELGRARGALDSGLRSAAYSDAEGQASKAADRRLSGASIFNNLSQTAGNNSRADVALKADLGGVQRQIAQEKATAPLSLAQAIATLLGQNQLGLLTGQHTQGTSTSSSNPSTIGAIGQGLQSAASIASLFAGMGGGAGGVGSYSGAGGFGGFG